MGVALIKLKIMPESLDIELEELKEKVTAKITEVGGEVTKYEEEPIAFGLKALITFIRLPESKDTSVVEEAMKNVEGVSSSDIIDYRRAVE
jgi:elongation factor 1-beta